MVISIDRYNRQTPDLLVASVTSNLRAIPWPGDYRVAQWQAAGLLKPSLVQMKLATVEATIVGRRLGRLVSGDLVALDRGLREALGLT